ncbi:MAG: cytochrome c oxidase subunit II [Planctomycetes bacterium]|nr:cytochrome c oxidase subunit II [Planctomycetota bacterium]
MMLRAGFLTKLTMRTMLVAIALCLATAGTSVAADTAEVDRYVERFNPDIFQLDENGKPVHEMKNAFSSPASDIAQDVATNNWFNLFVFMPFLILPQILLLVVIFKFRDRGDGRKPATFMTNHKLELAWTAIPCLALVIVSVPVWELLYKMELPPTQVDTNNPDQATIVKVTGRQFAWDYEYKHENISIGTDAAGLQEPLVLVLGRTTLLNITSNDVNHAWWVPAYGVKKDAFKGRYTNTWFTPTVAGVFKGNCAELCGPGHGIMFISSVVVTADEFDVYKSLQRHRADTFKIWNQLQRGAGETASDADLKALVTKYFEKDASDGRRFALRYWIAANFASLRRKPQDRALHDDVIRTFQSKRDQLEQLIATVLSSPKPVASAE